MIRVTVLVLVLVFGVTATRDIVCQLGCAEPGAAHAAAACHESGELAGTVLQAIAAHCTPDASPAFTAISVNALQHGAAVSALRSPIETLPLATPARFE